MPASTAAATADMPTPQSRFAALLVEHRGIVFKVANTYCRHPDDRQDLIQEISAQLWRAFPGYDPARPFATWMYRVALNVAISHVRKQKRAEHAPLDLDADRAGHDGIPPEALAIDDHSAQHERDERLNALYAIVDRLNPLDRALMLLWLDDRSQREIADVLGISESNVATKLNRLKQRMREQLTEYG